MRDFGVYLIPEPEGPHDICLKNGDDGIATHVNDDSRGPAAQEGVPDDEQHLAAGSNFGNYCVFVFWGDEPLEVPVIGGYCDGGEDVVGVHFG